MLREIRLLTRLENLNLYGLNRLKYTTDKREKRRIYMLSGVWAFVILVFLIYSGGYAYGLHFLGLTQAVPAIFTALVSIMLIFFGMFSASSNLFGKGGIDFLSALPVRPFSIVISRLVRLYLEDLVLCFLVTLPAIGVYAFFASPAFLFYPAWLISVLFMPLIPLSLSILLGAGISLLSSVFRKKALFQALITVVFVVLLFYGSTHLTKMADSLSVEAIRSLMDLVLKSLERIYPPAAWIGAIAVKSYRGLGYLIASGAAAILAAAFVTRRIFPFILSHSGAKGKTAAFSAEKSVKASALLPALIAREFRRYFSSNIYLLNTIISPVMAVGAAVMFLLTDVEAIASLLPFSLNMPLICAFLIGVVSSLMPPSAVSLSMEGKAWWLTKTLPVRTKDLLGAKILMSVLLHAPFLLIASVLTVISLAPDAWTGCVMFLTPFVLDAFSCTWGLFINTKLPRFDWDSEVYVVKQSAAAGVGGLTAPLIGLGAMLLTAAAGTIGAAVIALTVIFIFTLLLLKSLFSLSHEKL